MTFDYHEPATIADAVTLGARFGDDGRFLAGGTDLLVQIQAGRVRPRHVVSLHRLRELAALSVDRSNGGGQAPALQHLEIRLGALVTHRTIERTAAFAGALGALIEGAQVIGGHQVRNVATIGGNVMNASPAADLVPVLLALDGVAHLVGPAGEHTIPLDRFLAGRGRTERAPGELLTAVIMPALPPRSATAFIKAGRRKAMEISVVCVAARLTLDAGRGRCAEARIALGAVAPRTVRARGAERALEGQPLTPEVIRRAGELALADCDPISDVRASARFRRHLVGTLVTRALERCVARVEADGGGQAPALRSGIGPDDVGRGLVPRRE
jgi:carbon-monoxide dehydrogenase medium subunit